MLNLPPKKVRLSDGTELEVNWCGASEGILWIDGIKMELMDAVVLFSDPTKTSSITAPYEILHEGYTKLINISLSTIDGQIKLALQKQITQ